METCTKHGRDPLSITPRYRFIAPNRLVWNPSSIGGSKRHGRGRVDRDVDVARELRHAAGEVTVHDRDPFVQDRAQPILAEAVTQYVERRLAEEVLDAFARRGTGLRADQEDDPALGDLTDAAARRRPAPGTP